MLKFIIASLCGTLLFSSSHAQEVRHPIALDQIQLDQSGNFVKCTLADGRELVATNWMVSLGDVILAKSEPMAYESQSAQYLEFKTRRFDANVMKQNCAAGGKQGLGLQFLSGPNNGKTESHICVEAAVCK